jgi:SAM-dependent methyltransferase
MTDQSTDTATLAPLQQQAKQLCETPYFQDVIVRHCPALHQAGAASGLVTTIHPDDQMLNHSLFHHRDANAAFSQYYNVGLQQFSAAQQIIDLLLPGQHNQLQLLDFACGYGRLLRFMSQYLPRQNVFASEIQTDALRYVQETFKVAAIPSHGDPQAFQPNQRFDVIWVASLFSHLPKHLFKAWLGRLLESLTPDGILCFSVHDACLVPEGHQFPEEEGYLFWPQSENADLDTSLYGTTYVNEAFVQDMITQVCGAEQNYYRIPRALAHEQDIYVVTGSNQGDLQALQGFRRGPWGWVDERHLSDDGLLYLRGWAASVDDGPLSTILVTINGTAMLCPTGKHREDVGRAFNDSRLNTSGWEFTYQLPKGCQHARIEVTAATERHEYALLYTGDLYRPTQASATPTGAPKHGLTRLWQAIFKR